MTLTPGARLSSYEILESIGAGGMGEVYRARDTKLGREVAIKVLPEAFAEDKERLARFEREARLLASLNHPNIATLFDLQESVGVHFLVLEFVPGETLAERIAKGPIPIDEALPLFKHIAEGLEAAHEGGVIHRDLKPANIKVTPEGKVKVLDFGLAKAMAGEAAAQDLSESPTLTREATETGFLLGTAPYMSPEQTRGKTVDKKTDIWAFGCCLYEALTGKAAFLGETVSDTIVCILKEAPQWQALPDGTPSAVHRLIRRCLTKNPSRRLQHMGDARIEIEEAVGPTEITVPIGHRAIPVWKRALPWGVGALAVTAAVVSWFSGPRTPTVPLPTTRFTLELTADQRVPLDMDDLTMDVSRDGRRIAWLGVGEGERRLYTRAFDDLEVRSISGTEGTDGWVCRFSPDGRWVAFVRDAALWKIPVDGGVPTKLLESESATGIWSVDWGENGDIIVALAYSGLVRIPTDGGDPKVVTSLDREQNEVAHERPYLLPGDGAVLFAVAVGTINDERIEVLNLETSERRTLIEDASLAQYAPSGHILFARDGYLYATPFDLERLEVTGPDFPVLSQLQMDTLMGTVGQFSVSQTGTLIYIPGEQGFGERHLAWIDRQGETEYLPLKTGNYMAPTLSPSGKELAICHRGGHTQHIAIYDLRRQVIRQFTFQGSSHWTPVWSPDGSRLAFQSNRAGQWNLFVKLVGGDSPEVQLQESASVQEPWSWSPDGTLLAYSERSANDQFDIWLLPIDDTAATPIPLLVAEYNESQAMFSPSGKWIAYVSEEEGQPEVFVREFIREALESGRKFKVSRDGGWEPVWSPDGGELFYRNVSGNQLLSVSIQTEPQIEIGEERIVLEGLKVPTPGWLGSGRSYDVAPEGDRFLMVLQEENPETMELVVVLNWSEELKRLVPTN